MILTFGDDHWRTPPFKRRQNVIEDEIVPRRVLSKLCIKFLDGRLFIGPVPGKPELCAAEDNLMVEGPSGAPSSLGPAWHSPASEQGIFRRLAGNCIRRSRNFWPDKGSRIREEGAAIRIRPVDHHSDLPPGAAQPHRHGQNLGFIVGHALRWCSSYIEEPGHPRRAQTDV